MKKLSFIALCVALIATVSCGGNSNNKKAASGIDGKDAVKEAAAPVEKAYKGMTDAEQFEDVIKRDYGFKLADVKLDADFSEADTQYSGQPKPGHKARVTYKKASGNYTPEEIEAYVRKLFALTAAKSQDGKNVLGFGFSNDDPAHALDEADLVKELKATESKWCFRVKDVFYVCKVYAPKGAFIEATFVDGITKSVDAAVQEADKVMK